MRKFVKKSLDLLETGVQEAKLRVLLQFVADIQVEARSINIHVDNIEDVTLQVAAGPNLELLYDLIRFFTDSKRLGFNYRLPGLVDGGTKIPSSPNSWLQQLKSLASTPPISTTSSFASFLHIIAAALKTWKVTEKKKIVKLDNNVCHVRLKSANIVPDKHTSEYFLHHASSLLLLLVLNEESGVSILMSYGENPHYVKLPIFSEIMENSTKFMENSDLTKWTQNLS